jgi:hypothetical protein
MLPGKTVTEDIMGELNFEWQLGSLQVKMKGYLEGKTPCKMGERTLL